MQYKEDKAMSHETVRPKISHKTPFNQTSFSGRLQLTGRYLSRVHKHRGAAPMVVEALNPQTWARLAYTKRMDGLFLPNQYVYQR